MPSRLPMSVPKTMLLLLLGLLPGLQPATAQKNRKQDFLVTIETPLGTIHAVLFNDTPQHKENFLKLAQDGWYDSTCFHLILNDFMIIGGDGHTRPGADSTRIGTGSPGHTLQKEVVPWLRHGRGMIGAARQNDELNPGQRSSGSHFYIVQAEQGAPHLDGDYTVFGEVVAGMETVDELAAQEVDAKGRPLQRIPIAVTVRKMKKKDIGKQFGYSYR